MYYIGICKERNLLIKEEFCLAYAVDRVLTNNEDQREFIEWFYSGNWIKIEKGDDRDEVQKL